ncbi:MAG: YhcB family protein [Tolumonas sp.]
MTTEFTMILFVLIGLIIGFVAGRSTSRAGDAAKLHKELTKTRKEFEQYKRDVQDHFIGFSSLMEQLDAQYQRLSQHMTEQSEKLTNSQTIYSIQPDVPAEEKESVAPANEGVHQPKDYSGEPSGLLSDHKSS